MKAKLLIICYLICINVIGYAQTDTLKPLMLSGSWAGNLQGLRILFHVGITDDSTHITMDSPDQGVIGIVVNDHSVDRNHVIFHVDIINGIYAGDYQSDRDMIRGTWKQHGYEFPLDLVRTKDTTFLPSRPQEPIPPYPYQVEEVKFRNVPDQVELAGTLTIPEAGGPFPAVVLVSGSGLQDRNEEVMGHKPFLVIADYLTRSGIAVLRYDDRGFGESTGDFATATTADFARDALAALTFLRHDPRIIASRAGIIGHSEGAMIAPILAASDPDVAFIIMLAAPGLTGRETLNLQNEMLMKEYGEDPEYINKVLRLNNDIYDIAAGEADDDKAAEKIRKTFERFTSGMTPKEREEQGLTDYIVEKTIRDMLTPWMRYFLDLDIKEYLLRVHCPVLALYGSNDLQVDPIANIPPIEKTLKESGSPNYRVEILQGLNHLFQTSGTGLPSEYGTIEETFAPVVLELIIEWIHGIE